MNRRAFLLTSVAAILQPPNLFPDLAFPGTLSPDRLRMRRNWYFGANDGSGQEPVLVAYRPHIRGEAITRGPVR